MRSITTIIVTTAVVVTAIGAAQAQRQPRTDDVAGAADVPYLTRMPDAVIEHHEHQRFATYRVPVGPLEHVEETGGKAFAEVLEVAGEVTRVQYSLPVDQNPRFVHANYLQALEEGGYTVLFAGCGREELGQNGEEWWFYLHGDERGLNPVAGDAIAPRGDHPCYIAARKRLGGRDVYAVVYVVDRPGDWDFTLASVDIVETTPAETGLVSVDQLAEDLRVHGHVAVRGIYFDSGRAQVKDASRPALARVAKLLADRPDLALHVVGHTDDVGGLGFNLDLSRERAEAVVAALAEDHAITPGRLHPHGVGPLAPVASNATEAGRAQNRRVELVSKRATAGGGAVPDRSDAAPVRGARTSPIPGAGPGTPAGPPSVVGLTLGMARSELQAAGYEVVARPKVDAGGEPVEPGGRRRFRDRPARPHRDRGQQEPQRGRRWADHRGRAAGARRGCALTGNGQPLHGDLRARCFGERRRAGRSSPTRAPDGARAGRGRQVALRGAQGPRADGLRGGVRGQALRQGHGAKPRTGNGTRAGSHGHADHRPLSGARRVIRATDVVAGAAAGLGGFNAWRRWRRAAARCRAHGRPTRPSRRPRRRGQGRRPARPGPRRSRRGPRRGP